MAQSVKKIILVTSSWAPVNGGISDYSMRLMGALASSGVEVQVITSAEFNIQPVLESDLKVLPVIKKWHRNQFLSLLPYIWRFRPDWVIVQYPSEIPGNESSLSPWVPVFLKFFWPYSKSAYIVHEYADTLASNRPSLLRAFKFCRIVFCLNKSDKLALQNDGVDSTLTELGSSITYSELVDARINEPFFVYFGRQDERKGFGDLLAAIKELPDVRIKAIGPVNPSSFKAASSLGVSEQIEWCGPLEDHVISGLFQRSIASIAPFRDGVRPNSSSAIAAISNKSRIITTIGEDTPSYMIDDPAITLIQPNNPGVLAEAIRTYPQLATETQMKSLSELSKHLQWDRIAIDFTSQLK